MEDNASPVQEGFDQEILMSGSSPNPQKSLSSQSSKAEKPVLSNNSVNTLKRGYFEKSRLNVAPKASDIPLPL